MKAANLSEGEIVEAIPILKPSQITAVMESVDKQLFTSMNLLPYMETEDVKELALNLIAQGKPCDDCLPFMEEADVKELALALVKSGEEYENCLPFMAQADVKELVGVLLDEGRDCTSCLPFLGAQGVKELMSRYARG